MAKLKILYKYSYVNEFNCEIKLTKRERSWKRIKWQIFEIFGM